MRLSLSPQDAAFQQEMREFFTTKVPQEYRDVIAAGHHASREQIVATQQLLNGHGLAVPHWPVEWGGKDWSALRRHIWQQEMQLANVPPPLAFNVNMVGPVIAQFGSAELKERFLPMTANIDIWWCQGFSEPDAGSDLASLRTMAVRDGDEYVVNGQKTWTTLAQHADWIFALVRTNPDAPKRQQGISFLLVDMDTPGLTVRPIQLIDGGHEVNEVFFENVRVPVRNLVGEENRGWDYAKFLLGNERVGVAPVGSTKALLARAKGYAAEPLADGTKLIEDPFTAARIVELENDLLALELTALRVVASSGDGKPNPASSVMKLRGTQVQQAVTELIVDLAGPNSLASFAPEESDLPDWDKVATPTYLNYRKASIYGGSNEVQRTIIASSILGL